MRLATPIVFVAFLATVPAANWLIGNMGTTCIPDGPCLVPVGFGLMAPSGVLMIGLALVLRDWLHELAGWRWAVVAVSLGAATSLLVAAPAIAVASSVALLFAEMADLAVYARLRKKSKPLAVAASQIIGAAIDSALFVWIAFGSLDFSAGTALAKVYAGAAVALFLWVRGRCLLGHTYGPWTYVVYGGYDTEERQCLRCGKRDSSRSGWIGFRGQ